MPVLLARLGPAVSPVWCGKDPEQRVLHDEADVCRVQGCGSGGVCFIMGDTGLYVLGVLRLVDMSPAIYS